MGSIEGLLQTQEKLAFRFFAKYLDRVLQYNTCFTQGWELAWCVMLRRACENIADCNTPQPLPKQ